MLNEPPDRNPSEADSANQQLKLRIPLVQPAFMLLMLATLVAFFLVRIPTAPESDPLLIRLGAQGSAILERTQVYRLFSAQLLLEQPYWGSGFVAGLLSGLVSLYTFYIVGTGAERLWGHLRFALVFLLGGLAGTLLTMIFIGLNLVPADVFLATAPNAIMAVLAGEVVYMYRHRKLWGLRGAQRRIFLGGLASINLVLGAFASRVDLFGLLGGLIGGAVLAWYVAPLHLPRPHPEEPGALLGEDVNPLRSQWVTLALYVTALVGLLALGVTLTRQL